jgi:cytochrome c553
MRLAVEIALGTLLAMAPVAWAADGVPAKGKAKAEAGGCFSCHGPAGVATEVGIASATDKAMPNVAAEPDLYVQFQLVYFRNGSRKNDVMNGMAKDLSDEDVRNLGAFFASLPAPKTTPPPDSDAAATALGEKVAQGVRCANCHGDHFEGVDNIARLAGQREEYLYKALRDFKTGGVRPNTGAAGMSEVVYALGDPEMKALAHYLSRLP